MSVKVLFVLSLILIDVYCRPQPQFGGLNFITKTVPQIVNYNVKNFLRGFSFDVDTSDNFHHDATGELRSETGKEEDEGLEVQGSYSYVGDDGLTYRVDYTAGKEGFRPSGTHLVPSAGVKKLGVGSCTSASLAGCGFG